MGAHIKAHSSSRCAEVRFPLLGSLLTTATAWHSVYGAAFHVALHSSILYSGDEGTEPRWSYDNSLVDGYIIDWETRQDHREMVELAVVNRPLIEEKDHSNWNMFISIENGAVILAESYEDALRKLSSI